MNENKLPAVSSGNIARHIPLVKDIPDDYNSSNKVRLNPLTKSIEEVFSMFSTPIAGNKGWMYLIRGGKLKLTNGNESADNPELLYDHYHRNDDSLIEAEWIFLDADKGPRITGTEKFENAPKPIDCHNALVDIGIQHCIYTTASHGADKNKFRVVIPTNRAFVKSELKPTVDSILGALSAKGINIYPVNEMFVWSQPWFLPTKKSLEDGTFETYQTLEGNPLSVREAEGSHDPVRPTAPRVDDGIPKDDPFMKALMGESYHEPYNQMSMKHARGVPMRPAELKLYLHAIHEKSREYLDTNNPDAVKRFEQRGADIDRSVDSAFDTLTKPKPLPFFNRSKGILPIDRFPPAVRDAIHEYSKANDVPETVCALCAIGSLSIAIANAVEIEEVDGLWHALNFLLIIIAGSGMRKSQVWLFFMKRIIERQRIEGEKFDAMKRQYEIDKDIDAEIIKMLKAKLAKDATGNPKQSEERNRLVQMLRYQKRMEAAQKPQFICDDATQEALVKIGNRNRGYVAITSGEGNTAVDLFGGKYSDSDNPAVDVVVRGAVGERFGRDRAGGDEHVDMPRFWLSMLLMMQPKVAKKLYHNEKFADIGLYARIIGYASDADISKQRHNNEKPSDECVARLDSLMDYLLDANMAFKTPKEMPAGGVVWIEPRKLGLSEGAQKDLGEFFRENQALMVEKKSHIEFLNKIPSLACKLAGLFWMCWIWEWEKGGTNVDGLSRDGLINVLRDKNEVSREVMQDAIAVMKVLRDINLDIVDENADADIFDSAREVLGWLVKSEVRYKRYQERGFTKSDIMNSTTKGDSEFKERLSDGIMGLVIQGWLTEKPGRGGDHYWINFTPEGARGEVGRVDE